MVDDVDRSVEVDALEREGAINLVLKDAAAIPAGNPGICLTCDGNSLRLVGGNCASCRDAFDLP